MKKIMCRICMAIAISVFFACGNSNENVSMQTFGESVKTDITSKDVLPDAMRGNAADEGFGRCLESGCYCKKFKGRGQTCRNCGHAYKRHY